MNNIDPADSPFLQQVCRDGILQSTNPSFQMMTGGVSSEIIRVDDDGIIIVIKRALEKLKVEADWFADVSRNAYEVAYLEYVAAILPASVPRILARGSGYFAMEFLDETFENWKDLLKRKQCSQQHARSAGELLGKIHQYSFGDPQAAQRFNAIDNFIQLRISPYLYAIAEKHVQVASVIYREADRLKNMRECLIHGDFSPKNILISPARLVLVDCEVAYYGDPAFDIAFLLSHLFLKGLLHAPDEPGLKQMAINFLQAYELQRENQITDFQEIRTRTARLLTMLLLARVDGKSPVEYLTFEKQRFLRDFSLLRIRQENFALDDLFENWFDSISGWK